jgi:polyhydroxybutyrate depolymerase
MRRPHAAALATAATALALLTASGCSALSGGSDGDGNGNGSANGATAGRRAAPAPVPQASVPAGGRRPVPSTGCRSGQAPPATGRHGFAGRSYLLKRPNGDPRRPAPLILDLHGLHSSGFQQALYSQMATVGSARGFIVVEPDSAPGREGWKLPGMPDGSADVAYMGRLLDHLETALCVDRAHEFATGFSNGAGLATAMVCGLDGRLAGVAPIAGFNLARPCAGARPTTIVAFHGTADRIIPYRGGEPFGGDRTRVPPWMRPSDGAFALPSVRAAADGWARAFGCRTGEVRNVRTGGEIGRLGYPGCRGGARVDLYTVSGGGHTWPGGMPIGMGMTTSRLNATATILDAFART